MSDLQQEQQEQQPQEQEQQEEQQEQQQPRRKAKKVGFFKGLWRGFKKEMEYWSDLPPVSSNEEEDEEDEPTTGPIRVARPRRRRFPGFGRTAQPHSDVPDFSHLTTSDMTQDQLRARRVRLVESSKVARPFHEAFMLFLLKFWLVLGPPAFVGLTVFEVSYIFSAMLPPGDSADKIIFYGALFVDLAMMFTTFGVAIKRRDAAEKREVNGGKLPLREEWEVHFGTFLWLVFAAINVIGQSAFLLHIVQGSKNPGDLNLIYLFIAARVTGFILGDATTAFFLSKVDGHKLDLIARSERKKAALYSDISSAEAERRLAEAKAEAEQTLIELEVQQKKEDAEFLAAIKRDAFARALGRQPDSTPAEPTRSRVYRGNT